MPKFNIVLPEAFDVASRGKSVTVDVTKLPAGLIEKLVLHGLKQKVSDAAAGAKTAAGDGATEEDIAATGKSLMQKVVDSLHNGEWGVERGNGSAVDPVTAEIRMLLRGKVKAGTDGAKWKAMDEAERVELIDDTFAKQSKDVQDALTEAAEASIARKAAEKKATAAIAVKL